MRTLLDARNRICLACLLVLLGCGYGEVAPVTYQYAQSLITVCSLKDEARLAEIETKIKTLQTDGELPEREAGWLLEIVELAKSGNWEQAGSNARALMKDQAR